MRYYVTLDPTPGVAPLEIDVVELPSGALSVHIGGREIAVDVSRVPAALSVRVEGQVVDLTIEGTPPELGAVASGHRSYVRVESERMRAAAQATKGAHGASEKLLRSPMPGRVIKILVQTGDEVAAGQALLVIEAMKMENELKAKAPGRVGEVLVAVGATVEGNAKLITFA
jgi:biotin carboxyl carrier protein